MKTKMKLEKIEKSMSGVKFAHINLFIDIEDELNDYAVGTWKLQCTGMAIVVKGNHNLNSLKWFTDKLFDGGTLALDIDKFAREMIKADDLVNAVRECA
tara:strand:- start:166 stop:462 length:297 start_codon:yes stop_codon:yes gene_type:complete